MLQNLKMLGNSIAQTTIFDQFEANHEQDYGDTEDNGQHWKPKNDNDIENAVRIKFTKEPNTYQKKKRGRKRKKLKIVTATGKVQYAYEKYVCDSCDGFETSTKDKLLKHQFEDHGQTLCSDCGATFEHYDDLRVHRFSHEAPVKCDFCEEVFVNPRSRLNHMRNKHGKSNAKHETKLICPRCGDTFNDKIVLNRHLLRKHDEGDLSQKFQCPHCQVTTWRQADMNRHLKVHDKSLKPKPCPFCNRLVRHLRDHLQKTQCDIPENERTLKTYKCVTCNKTFAGKGGYDRHMKNFHSEAGKNHKCDLCSYATYDKFNLFIHVRRMHEGKKLKRMCPYCSKEVVKLEFHIGLFHPEFADLPTTADDCRL